MTKNIFLAAIVFEIDVKKAQYKKSSKMRNENAANSKNNKNNKIKTKNKEHGEYKYTNKEKAKKKGANGEHSLRFNKKAMRRKLPFFEIESMNFQTTGNCFFYFYVF